MARPGTFGKGHAKRGGRKKGVPNKDSQEAKERLQQLLGETISFTPLQIMYAVMQIKLERGDPDGALVAAEKAAPYVHARLNATDVRVQHSVAGKSDTEVAAEIEALRAKLAVSRSLAPPAMIEASADPIEVLPVEPVAAAMEVEPVELAPASLDHLCKRHSTGSC
jgi:hypothetical protein